MVSSEDEEIKVYVRRVSRELDRFVITLMELEASTTILLQHIHGKPPSEALSSIQKIDYLCQCSSALSEVLTCIANRPLEHVRRTVDGLKPADLSDRLKDQCLDDIDNKTSQIEVF